VIHDIKGRPLNNSTCANGNVSQSGTWSLTPGDLALYSGVLRLTQNKSIRVTQKNMKILVAGTAGFVGLHLAMRLFDWGVTLFGFGNVSDYCEMNLKKAGLLCVE
jgi:hypothetical protein